MKPQTTNLLVLGFLLSTISWAVANFFGGFDPPWDGIFAGAFIGGIVLLVLAGLSAIGWPKSTAKDEGKDDEDTDKDGGIELWQLLVAATVALFMIATDDPAVGRTGDFWDSWYFWASFACFAVIFVMNLLPWLIALFAEEEDPDLVSHGSARFATDEEIAESGLLTTEHGAYLGHHAESGGGLVFGDDGHLITVATAGAGKGTCSVIPNLLNYEGSVLCTDPKGENAAITARHRREMGQDVYVLNPWGLHSGPPWNLGSAAFNPLDWLDTTSLDVADDAAMLANAIILRDKGSSGVEGHFTDEAESLITGIILYVAFMLPPQDRNLITVRELITQPPNDWKDLLDKMSALPQADGLIARAANRFMSKSDREGPAVLSTAQRHTDFLDSPRMKQTLSHSDFDLTDLKRKRMTIYLCLPFEHVSGRFSRWLRLMITLSLMAMARTPGATKPGVLFLLDEFAAMGHMKMAERGMAEGRGYGIKMWPILQDLSQLKDTYGERWQTFLANARVMQFFGTGDLMTAEYVSKLLGQTTVLSISSREEGSDSASETGRSLMNPDEVLRLDQGEELLFVQGLRPIKAQKLPYYLSKQNEYADANPLVAEHVGEG